MTPIEFEGCNTTIAKDQPQYIPLPALSLHGGDVTFCWRLTWKERIKLLFTGTLWHTVMTFRHPLQPQMLSVTMPDVVRVNAQIIRELRNGQ